MPHLTCSKWAEPLPSPQSLDYLTPHLGPQAKQHYQDTSLQVHWSSLNLGVSTRWHLISNLAYLLNKYSMVSPVMPGSGPKDGIRTVEIKIQQLLLSGSPRCSRKHVNKDRGKKIPLKGENCC